MSRQHQVLAGASVTLLSLSACVRVSVVLEGRWINHQRLDRAQSLQLLLYGALLSLLSALEASSPERNGEGYRAGKKVHGQVKAQGLKSTAWLPLQFTTRSDDTYLNDLLCS